MIPDIQVKVETIPLHSNCGKSLLRETSTALSKKNVSRQNASTKRHLLFFVAVSTGVTRKELDCCHPFLMMQLLTWRQTKELRHLLIQPLAQQEGVAHKSLYKGVAHTRELPAYQQTRELSTHPHREQT